MPAGFSLARKETIRGRSFGLYSRSSDKLCSISLFSVSRSFRAKTRRNRNLNRNMTRIRAHCSFLPCFRSLPIIRRLFSGWRAGGREEGREGCFSFLFLFCHRRWGPVSLPWVNFARALVRWSLTLWTCGSPHLIAPRRPYRWIQNPEHEVEQPPFKSQSPKPSQALTKKSIEYMDLPRIYLLTHPPLLFTAKIKLLQLDFPGSFSPRRPRERIPFNHSLRLTSIWTRIDMGNGSRIIDYQ